MDEDLADQYAHARKAGQDVVGSHWRCLAGTTRRDLQASGCYSERGRVVTEGESDEIESLEGWLGLFSLCLKAKLPSRGDKDAEIPLPAFRTEVMGACSELLGTPRWHDPAFLRTALAALAKHQESRAVEFVGPRKFPSAVSGCIVAVVRGVFLVALPAALAGGLTAAGRGDAGGAVLGFYIAACGVLAALPTAKTPTDKQELTYEGWRDFNLQDRAGMTGAGAMEYLRRMAADGVRVPAVAFDLADMLARRVAAEGISESIKEGNARTGGYKVAT